CRAYSCCLFGSREVVFGSDVHLDFFFSSRSRHTRLQGDWSSDVCSSDLGGREPRGAETVRRRRGERRSRRRTQRAQRGGRARRRSEEHTSELQSPCNLVCRLLLEKKKQS